jgi:arylformamidase
MIILSHIIDSETPTYGNRDKFIAEEPSCIRNGDTANSSKWTFTTNHLGTHIDMPKHFFENGQTLTDVPIGFWTSEKVQLLDVRCSSAKLINKEDLKNEINLDTEVLFIRTGYELFRKTDKYWNDNPGLSAELGIWLRNNRPNIRIIGFDFISLTSWKFREEGKKAHHSFLDPKGYGKPICIIEDMKLCAIKNSIVNIIISPIFVRNSNGSPVTVFVTDL